MKKALVGFFMCLLVFNTGGYFILFKYQQNQIRKEIKGKLKSEVPENELLAIKIDKENSDKINWIHKKEFRYEGVMYDVVKTKIIDQHTVIYYCVNDHQETVLFSNLDEMVNSGMGEKQKSNSTLKLIFNLLTIQFLTSDYHSFFDSQKSISFAEPVNYYNSPFFDISSPPPELS